jgi:hypothetical protein
LELCKNYIKKNLILTFVSKILSVSSSKNLLLLFIKRDENFINIKLNKQNFTNIKLIMKKWTKIRYKKI